MSRQYDDYQTGKFELYGEIHELIEPESFDELLQAYEVKDTIQTAISGLMHDEDSSGWCSLLQEQEDFIQQYLLSLGEFDNRFLISNINYFTKKSNLRIGEVENMLGLSAGYISRTAKADSQKKLSIDVVWKISKLFEVDIKDLLNTDMRIPNSNTELVKKFLIKTYNDTEAGILEWKCKGGVMLELDDSIQKLKLVSIEGEKTIYNSTLLNPEAEFILCNDIFSSVNIGKDSELFIIPICLAGSKEKIYEFIFKHNVEKADMENSGDSLYKTLFTTADDPFGNLEEYANKLYHLIQDRMYDTRLSSSAKSIISKYINTN